jgi:hypothetical protein
MAYMNNTAAPTFTAVFTPKGAIHVGHASRSLPGYVVLGCGGRTVQGFVAPETPGWVVTCKRCTAKITA